MNTIVSNPVVFGHPNNLRSSVGHCFHNHLTALILARYFGFNFVGTPFSGDSTKYNSILNITNPKDRELFADAVMQGAKVITLDLTHESFSHDKVISEVELKTRLDSLREKLSKEKDTFFMLPRDVLPGNLLQYYHLVYDELQKNIVTNYLGTKLEYSSCCLVHVRRGDITQQNNSDRYTSTSAIAARVANLLLLYPEITTIYYITEASPVEIDAIHSEVLWTLAPPRAREVRYFRSASPDVTLFCDMIYCKYLIADKSTWSYLAGYMNTHPEFVFHAPECKTFHLGVESCIKAFNKPWMIV